MLRKWFVALCVIAALIMPGSGLVNAADNLPTWETVFNPGPYMAGSQYLVQSMTEYKGELFIVAGDPMWFEWLPEVGGYGQVFRSPDGRNWQPASDIGFGLGAVDDECGPKNYYDTSWDMTVFQDKLYLIPFETCYLRPGVILRSSDGNTWESIATTEEFGLNEIYEDAIYYHQFHKFGVFNGMLYVNADYYDTELGNNDSKVFRSPTGDPGTWEEVIDFPGWGFPGSFHVFKGALYLASDGIYSGDPDWIPLPEQIWRTYDGVKWEMVVGDGFGNPGSDGLGGFADYKGYLYVGVGTYEGGGGQIWRSQDGFQWEAVILDGFGNPLDDKIDGLVVYHGDLYAYTVNWTEGCSVFRTKDAMNWERVNQPGWGDPTFATTHQNSGQVVFKDELYMGVIAPKGVLLRMVHPLE